jgi:phosphate transport system permease protein
MVVLTPPHEQVVPEPLEPISSRVRRIRPRDFKGADALLVAASLLSSASIVWILFSQLTLLSGIFGFIVCWVVAFLAVYWAVNRQFYGRFVAADRFTGAAVTLGALCLVTPLVLLIAFLITKGAHLLSFHLFVATQSKVLEHCVKGFPCPKPGLAHAIVGTFEQVGIAIVIGVPAAILTAIYLNEIGKGRLRHAVRIVVTSMSGLPAIVAGVFVYTVWIIQFHKGFSGIAGSLALSILLLPAVTRGTEEVLKIVPDELREASLALGATQARTVFSVVLPTAQSGIITAVLLGIAVAMGETAPLLFTVFGNKLMNANPFSGPQASLSLLVFQEVKSSQSADVSLGYTAALVLFILVFVAFISARVLGSEWFARKLRGEGRKKKKMMSLESAAAATLNEGGLP